MICRTFFVRSLSILFLALVLLGTGRTAIAQASCSGKDALTSKACAGDGTSSDEQALFDLVLRYRAANGLPTVRLSPSLSMVANRHIIDLVQNVKSFTHGWSNCPYDINDEKTWPCVSDSPKRLNSGYSGQAFETLFRTAAGRATPSQALEAWKKSKLHNSIILNLDAFRDMQWDEVGVAIDSGYAVLWFGSPGRKNSSTPGQGNGLGIGYEQALTGLSKLMSMKVTSVGSDTRWLGLSPDKKVKLEILGSPSNIAQAVVWMDLGSGNKLSMDDQRIVETLMRNLFPDWSSLDTWLSTSIAAVLSDNSVWRAKMVRGIKIDLRAPEANSVRLLVKP